MIIDDSIARSGSHVTDSDLFSIAKLQGCRLYILDYFSFAKCARLKNREEEMCLPCKESHLNSGRQPVVLSSADSQLSSLLLNPANCAPRTEWLPDRQTGRQIDYVVDHFGRSARETEKLTMKRLPILQFCLFFFSLFVS